MTIAVVDWNVNGFVEKDQVSFLDGLHWDLALLQEVTRDTWPRFRRLGTDGAVASTTCRHSSVRDRGTHRNPGPSWRRPA